MTKYVSMVWHNYEEYRSIAKTPGPDQSLAVFMRDVYKGTLIRCHVRIIPSVIDLLNEEPSGALSDFLCKYFERRVKHADNQTSDVQSRGSR